MNIERKRHVVFEMSRKYGRAALDRKRDLDIEAAPISDSRRRLAIAREDLTECYCAGVTHLFGLLLVSF